MRPASTSFFATIRGAHRAVFRARICTPGQTGVNPTGTEIPILAGDVQFDTTSDVNATLDLTTIYDWPANSAAFGTPYGSEIFVERGVMYGNGIKEFVGLGYFRIDSVEQVHVPNGAIRITGSDRMANVRDGRALQPVQFGAGASFAAVVDFVIGDVVPGYTTAVYDFDAAGTAMVSSHILSEDRVQFLSDILGSYGKIGYFRYDGRFVVRTAPSATAQPVYTIDQGASGVLVQMSRNINRDGVYNAVVASGESVDNLPPVMSIAYDSNPASPTLFGGAFGKVPRFFSSSFLTTTLQCDTAAQSLLASAIGLPYNVSLGTVPNPALEGWDVVTVKYTSNQNETHILDKITYPLSVDGVMQMTTRKQYL